MSKSRLKETSFLFTGCRLSFLCLVLVLGYSHPALGVTCHCFKERDFRPSQPASADAYILSTTRNSLLAAASGIEKGTVVRHRMRGTTEADLWLSYYLSTKVDRSAEELLNALNRSSSWTAAFDALGLDTGSFGRAFNEARSAGSAEEMARALADPVLGRAFGADGPTLLLLRRKMANIAESALCLYLAGMTKRTPGDILNEVRKGKQTWGSLLNSQGIETATVGDRIAEKARHVGR